MARLSVRGEAQRREEVVDGRAGGAAAAWGGDEVGAAVDGAGAGAIASDVAEVRRRQRVVEIHRLAGGG